MAEQLALSMRPDMAIVRLEAEAEKLMVRPGRSVLGIAGGPGVGKSTLALRLVEALNRQTRGVAAYVPMDGFHMKQSRLEALGTAGDKGMPHTFDVDAFETFLARLKATHVTMSGPGYSRRIEDVVDEAYSVEAETKVLVVEGNYLLMADSPWWRIRPLIDLSVFLYVPRDLVEQRLLRRHGEAGLFSDERTRAHVARVDLPNYDLVQRSSSRADLVIRLLTET
jgi:pantothenate kinase